MADKDNMATDDFMKSLDALEKLAHGEIGNSQMKKSVEGEGARDDLINESPDKSILDEPSGEPAEVEVLKKGDPDNDDDPDNDQQEDEDTEKSFAQEAAENSETIHKAIEVSDFLADLVGEIGGAIDGIRANVEARMGAMEKSITAQADFNKSLATALKKSFKGTKALLEKSIVGGEDLKKSLEGLGNQPAHGRKSKTSVLEKSFAVNNGGKEPLRKSQVLSMMTNAVISGDGTVNGVPVNGNDVMKYETSGFLGPDLKKALGLTGE